MPVSAVAVSVPVSLITVPGPPMLLEPTTVRFTAVVPVMRLLIVIEPPELLNVIVSTVKSRPAVVEISPSEFIVNESGGSIVRTTMSTGP